MTATEYRSKIASIATAMLASPPERKMSMSFEESFAQSDDFHELLVEYIGGLDLATITALAPQLVEAFCETDTYEEALEAEYECVLEEHEQRGWE